MNEHISKDNILKYAAGMLSPEDRQDIDKHLSACSSCLAKVAHGYAKSSESCVRAQELFAAYLDNSLDQQEADFVQQHLIICDSCLAKYDVLVEKRATAESSVNDADCDNIKSEEDMQIEKRFKEQCRQVSADSQSEELQKSKSRDASSSANKKKRT